MCKVGQEAFGIATEFGLSAFVPKCHKKYCRVLQSIKWELIRAASLLVTI